MLVEFESLNLGTCWIEMNHITVIKKILLKTKRTIYTVSTVDGLLIELDEKGMNRIKEVMFEESERQYEFEQMVKRLRISNT